MTNVTSTGARASLLLLLTCWLNLPSGVAAASEQVMENDVYSTTMRSPSFILGPGHVIDEEFHAAIPGGHIALRSFDAQLVDEQGAPVPVHEAYLHHWALRRYFVVQGPGGRGKGLDSRPVLPVLVRNAGVCQVRGGLTQWFGGLGSESRLANGTLPLPYGVVVGDSDSVPPGFEEAWLLNLHAIDTRGTVDARGCMECVCAFYNVTTDKDGVDLPEWYEGGLECCHGGAHCAVLPEFEGGERKLFVEYTVTWMRMTEEIVPLRVYVLDVTDQRSSLWETPRCEVEYTVQKCAEDATECLHTAESNAFLSDGGDVVYAVAHQHSGGVGSSLYNEEGAVICSSFPIYGKENIGGNESGYIVGMTPCYPEPGTVRIRSGERLRLTSSYNNEEQHTSAMGLFYLLVADHRAAHLYSARAIVSQARFHDHLSLSVILLAVTFVTVLVLIRVSVGRYRRRGRVAGMD